MAGSRELWSRARSAVQAANAFTPEDRRHWRRELRVERAQRKRLEREIATLRDELAKCGAAQGVETCLALVFGRSI